MQCVNRHLTRQFNYNIALLTRDCALACIPPSELTAEECMAIMKYEKKRQASKARDEMFRKWKNDSPWLPKVSVFAPIPNLDKWMNRIRGQLISHLTYLVARGCFSRYISASLW